MLRFTGDLEKKSVIESELGGQNEEEDVGQHTAGLKWVNMEGRVSFPKSSKMHSLYISLFSPSVFSLHF